MKLAMHDPNSAYVQDFIQGATAIVEATNFEYSCLWERYHKTKKWDDRADGIGPVVGYVDQKKQNKAISISLRSAVVDGQKILFWFPMGRWSDYDVIEEWIKQAMPETAFQDGRLNKQDAGNFICVLRH